MKTAPFLVSTILAFLCVVLSILSFSGGQKGYTLQSDLLKKQTEGQELSQKFSIQNAEFQRQTQAINTAQTVVQKAAPILQWAGYLTAKNKNEKLKAILVRQNLEKSIPTDDQLKLIEKQLEDAARAKQGQPAAGSALIPPVVP